MSTARRAAKALALGHAAVTATGMLNTALTTPPPRPTSAAPSAQTARLLPVVKKIYSGGGIDAAMLAEDASWTDMTAACHGRTAFMETAHALAVKCMPEHVEEPIPMPATGSESAFFLSLRYFGSLEVKSVLVVGVDKDGRITTLEDRLNGAPLLEFSAFRFVRRVNGVFRELAQKCI